jgi:DNA-binding NarL/FixJ family response regulator
MLALQATSHGRNVKKSLLPEPSEHVSQCTVLLCGDVLLHRRLLGDATSIVAGLKFIRCPEHPEQPFSLCQQLSVSLFVARQAFIEQLPSAAFRQLTTYGKGCSVLAVLESDILERKSAARMLRLGCRGVLPRGFSSTILKRAVLAILKGQLWAPSIVLSDVLSDLLRTASLKVENGLTPQEARILELSSQGYKNSAIAEALFISLETVRWHRRRLNRKLRLSNQPRYPQTKIAPPDLEKAVG